MGYFDRTPFIADNDCGGEAMKPDLDAIRAEHCNPNLINAGARKAVRELLAYVADLEERCRAYEAMRSDIARAIDTWKQEEVGDEA